MHEDYLKPHVFKEQQKTYSQFPAANRMLKEKQLHRSRKKNKSRTPELYVRKTYERRREMSGIEKSFFVIGRIAGVITKTCSAILKGKETLLGLALLAGTALFGVMKYVDIKESKFNSEYAPEGESFSGMSTGHMSKEGKERLKKDEGLRLEAYDLEGKGVYTIGYGHYGTIDGKPITKGMTITKEKADELFEKDVAAKEVLVKQQLKANGITTAISQKQFDAMVNYAFMHKLGPKFLAKLKAGDYIGASKELDFDRGMKNVDRMKRLQESFREDVGADNKLKPEIVNMNVGKTDAGKIRRISNGTQIGEYVMSNPVAHGGKYYIDLSERAEAYLRESGGSGLITSGAEGSHGKGTVSHGSGNKIDVAAKSNSYEGWADTVIPFIRNKNTAYINFESFTVAEFNAIKQIIIKKAPDTASRFNEKSKYSFDKQKRFIFYWMNEGHGKHLDIGIKPDSYSEKQYKQELKEVSKNTTKVENNNNALQEKNKKKEDKPIIKPSNPTSSDKTLTVTAPTKSKPNKIVNIGKQTPQQKIKQENEDYRRHRK